MSLDELARLDATAQAEWVRTRRVSALELVDAAIARLEREQPRLNIAVSTDFERARERARAVDGDRSQAPFAGVPTLLKDIGAEEAGQPLAMGMRLLRDGACRPAHDSHFLARLLAAGLIPLGRTNLPELAIMATSEPAAFGPTRNPWHPEHSAGGSSGGSAAAVAAGVVPVAHATDGGGSIRGPANMCGLVGLKPTRARTSLGPAIGEHWSSLSVEFMLTRSVRDCAALLDALAGAGAGDPYSAAPPAQPYALALQRRPQKLRVALLAHGPERVAVDPACAAAVHAMGDTLRELGHHVEEAHPDVLMSGEGAVTWMQLVSANVARDLEKCAELIGRPVEQGDVEPLTFAMAEMGRSLSATQLLQAIERMHAYGRRLRAFFADRFDLLLTPVQAAPPPLIGHLSSSPEQPLRGMGRSVPYGVFTLPFNLSGQPAIALPAALTGTGLPVGIQLAADYGREDLLLQVAAQIETARPFPALG